MTYLKHFVKLSAIASFVLPQIAAALLPLGPSALAGIVAGYVPPFNRPLLQRTEGAGSRGCNQKGAYLQLLAPPDHIAATTSERPTFLWYVGKTSMPIRFTLLDPAREKPIVERQLNPSQAGILAVDLPSSTKLAVGKKYRWMISLVCNQVHPSENTYAYAWMERVPMSTALKQALQQKDNTQKAIAYAQAGIWYDALAQLYRSHITRPKDKQAAQNFFDFLNQVGLSKVVEQEVKIEGGSDVNR